jgi:hypothetical protein
MNTIETKNKILYSRIVEKAFGFDYEDFKLFKHRLFFERDIAPEYKKIIKDAPDLRARFKINGEVIKDNSFSFNNPFYSEGENDKGWKIFRDIYDYAVREFSIKYNNFLNNKIFYRGNEYKLAKFLKDIAYEYNVYNLINNASFMRHLTHNEDFKKGGARILKFILKSLNIKEELLHEENIIILKQIKLENSEKEGKDCIFSFKYVIQNESCTKNMSYSIDVKIEELDDIISFYIKTINEIIGIYKMPNKELELVFSLNPIDWFLCSTKEKWSSCLNLENSNEVFWQGLPSLIGDKNRAMVYITDGSKKNFMGIKVDRFISRSWVLLVRSKEDNKTHFHIVREYPTKIGFKEIIKNAIGIDFKSVSDLEVNYNLSKIVSRYYIELLLNNDIFYSTIYFDSTKVKIAKKNKAKYKFGEYGFYKLGTAGDGGLRIDKINKKTNGFYYEETPSLDFLIDMKGEITEFIA